MAEAILCCGVEVDSEPEVVIAEVVIAVTICVIVNCSLGSVLLVVINGLVHMVGSISVCLIS